MKYMLYTAVEESPSREFIDPDLLNRYFMKFNEKFFEYCSTELEKINLFYAGKRDGNVVIPILLFRFSLHFSFFFILHTQRN